MRKQTKPFIVEIKPSRKPNTGLKKTSIWGKVDLRSGTNRAATPDREGEPATLDESGRP
ncbi:hypothetical protein [Mesorhizobium sp.]|uniref:hypothetical protein n=1 Tax=Mesorhizobium sp. TaxID=1871066 RepID=UPI0025C3AF19|nr:hypothetical protein [Mesorhizobium sp.]